MDLKLSQIDLYTKQPYILKDFYETVLELRVTYQNPEGTAFELSDRGLKLVLLRSITTVTNKIRLGFTSENLKALKVMLGNKNVRAGAIKVKEGRFYIELKDPDGNEVIIYQL